MNLVDPRTSNPVLRNKDSTDEGHPGKIHMCGKRSTRLRIDQEASRSISRSSGNMIPHVELQGGWPEFGLACKALVQGA